MFTIGLDFGTNACRAIVVACADGRVAGTGVSHYHSGDHGVLTHPSDPHVARQNPADYIGSLGEAISAALADASRSPGFSRDRVIGIGAAATGSTPLPIDAQARPLAIDPRFESDLAALAWLWKDHTASDEAAAITAIAREHAPEYLAPIGGTYSSEWWWSKIWKCLKVAPEVFDAAASWVELSDFVPAVLAGTDNPRDIVRSVCAAGHKAMYADTWGGLPSKAFLTRLDPKLADLRDRLYERALAPGTPAGNLSREWARVFGLRDGIVIAMGGLDAHYGAVGAGIEAGTLVKIIGTSSCDCAIAPSMARHIPGICGLVNGSILPGYVGIEAGQPAVGDILNWAVGITGAADGAESAHGRLTREAASIQPGQSGLMALDWHNGNRSVLVDSKLTGLIVGLTLHTTPGALYRALIEATAFGARAIIERLREHGVPVERVVCCGGIAEKNDTVLQIYADVIGEPLLVAGSSHTPALGAAMAAAVTAGEHPSWLAAQQAMTPPPHRQFVPSASARAVYDDLYAIYRDLHDEFGGVRNADLGRVMKQLLAIQASSASDNMAP